MISEFEANLVYKSTRTARETLSCKTNMCVCLSRLSWLMGSQWEIILIMIIEVGISAHNEWHHSLGRVNSQLTANMKTN